MDETTPIALGDLVQMRKKHPCGSDQWTIIRTGADIKIRCRGCDHVVMMDRVDFLKRCRKILVKAPRTDDTELAQ